MFAKSRSAKIMRLGKELKLGIFCAFLKTSNPATM